MYARPIPVQTKVHFKILQFLAVTYDMGVLSCAFDVKSADKGFFLFSNMSLVTVRMRSRSPKPNQSFRLAVLKIYLCKFDKNPCTSSGKTLRRR